VLEKYKKQFGFKNLIYVYVAFWFGMLKF